MKLLASIVLLQLLVSLSSGTIYVSNNGTDDISCGTTASPCQTIAFALEAASQLTRSQSDTIYLQSPGPFVGTGNVDITFDNGKNITIIGETEDCEGASRFLFANHNVSGVSLVLEKLSIRNCATTTTGGAIDIARGSLTLRNCVFERNTATVGTGSGGAVYIDSLEQLTIENCAFNNNSAIGGGALLVSATRLSITNSTFSYNRAQTGAAILLAGPSPFNIVSSNFTSNAATAEGGAIYADYDGYLTDCIFTDNSAPQGGAWYGYFSNSIQLRCRYEQNRATLGGGAVYITGLSVAAFTCTDCTFNQNSGGEGGAIYSDQSTGLTLNNCNIQNSQATNGGAIRSVGSIFTISGSSIRYNSAVRGGGLYVSTRTKGTISNTAISNNDANNEGGGIFCSDSTLTMNSVEFTNNDSPIDEFHCAGTPIFTHCATQGSGWEDKCEAPEESEVHESLALVIGLSVTFGVILIALIGFVFLLRYMKKNKYWLWKEVASDDN